MILIEKFFNTLDEELFAVCLVNKYMQQVCNESFWRNKFIREFGTDLGKYADKSYKNLYKKLKSLNYEKLLKFSVKRGYLSLIRRLIKINNINIRSNNYNINIRLNNYNMLTNASDNGHLDTVKYLVENGANIHAGHDEALRNAAYNGHLDVIKYLIENGANIHANDDAAVCDAAENGYLDVIKYLVENGLIFMQMMMKHFVLPQNMVI
jgi:hypothetical protein